jgi:hypothetical protein
MLSGSATGRWLQDTEIVSRRNAKRQSRHEITSLRRAFTLIAFSSFHTADLRDPLFD